MTTMDRWLEGRADAVERYLRTCSTRERIALDLIGAAVLAFVAALIVATAGGFR